MHQGPYSKIRPAYDALKKFVKSQDKEATGVAYEYYLNDPKITKTEDLLTRIVFPLNPINRPAYKYSEHPAD